MSSSDLITQQHLPGRSQTKSAWRALIILLLLVALWIFHPVILRTSVRSLLWATRPLTGITVKERNLHIAFGEPLRWEKATITTGNAPYQSQIELEKLSITLTSPWRMIFGDHIFIDSIDVSGGKGIIDLRTEKPSKGEPFFKRSTRKLSSLIEKKFTPSTISLNAISLTAIAENQRYSITNLHCLLSQKTAGNFSYQTITIETGDLFCHLPGGKCEALWDGKVIALKNLSLPKEITLRDFQLTPHADHIEFGFSFEIFQGIVRADGSISKNQQEPMVAGAILGQKLSLDRLSNFLGLTEKISGNLREGRLSFRGSPLHIIDAEASLRLIADNFRWKKRGWAALSVVANLIGRKVSLTDFQLKQHDNRVTASGEITLPTDWHKIAQAPFLLNLKAAVSDTSQLADLMGPPWNKITGKLFIDGKIQGAENRANGYLNAQGNSMAAYGLPLNSLKLQLLFQNEKTALTNLDIWNGSDRLQLSGLIENCWPHHYEGKGNINTSNLAEKLNLLGLVQKNLLSGGNFTASWNGTGTATNHNGSFNIALHNITSDSEEISGNCTGSYTPEQLSCPLFSLEENSNRLNMAVSLGSQGITLKNIDLTDNHQPALSGNIFLPINARTLFHEENWTHCLMLTTPMNIDLAADQLKFDHFLPLLNNPLYRFFNNEISTLKSKFFPNDLYVKQGIASGRVSIQGLFYEPKFSGLLQLQAEELGLGTILPPLKKAHSAILFTPSKITVNEASAMMGTGKVSATGSSDLSFWQKREHHYHIFGEQLSLYQSLKTRAVGNVDITLQGNSDKGTAQGNINLTEIHTPTQLYITPFLIPPGIVLTNELSTSIISIPTSWKSDIAINNLAEKTTPFGKSTLHLVGNLFSPSLEGSLSIHHLPLVFPQTKFSVSKGSLNFTANQPWNPELQLTASGSLHGKKTLVHLLDTANQHSISFQSSHSETQASFAMLLALPNDPHQQTPGWIDEVPYWIRQEQLYQQPPTTSPLLKNAALIPAMTLPENDGLGFSGDGISYYFGQK